MIAHNSPPIRIALVAASPVIYQVPLYQRLANDSRVDLKVIFASNGGVRPYDAGFSQQKVVWDVDLVNGYKHEFLRRADQNELEHGFFGLRDWDIIGRIWSGRYDALWVHGYSYLTLWLAILTAKLAGSGLLIREEQTLLHSRTLKRELIRGLVLRSLFRNAFGLYIGSNNRDFFRAYGVPDDRLFPAPYCVDNESLQNQARQLAAQREQLRERMGVGGTAPVILFVGRLRPKKGVMTLLEAFIEVRSKLDCKLLVAGSGPLEESIRERAAKVGTTDVVFTGFLNRSEIGTAYAVADIFCLPSILNETWGIVVNEAMNFSLPIIVTDKVGSARDLVRPAVNGDVVRAGHVAELAVALRELVAKPALRRRYAAKSLEIISAWDYGRAVEGIVAAALAARDQRLHAKAIP